MATMTAAKKARGPRKARSIAPSPDTPPEGEKFAWLLGEAATLIARMGYHHMSMRDVSRATGYSLAGLYHYLDGKEDLLFQIQHRFFSTLVEEQGRIASEDRPVEERLRALIENHMAFFADRPDELKVCTFELHTLEGGPFDRVAAIRKRYFRLMAAVIKSLGNAPEGKASALRVRHQTMFVFGALNWIFMWYVRRKDGPVEKLGSELTEFILQGVQSSSLPPIGKKRRPARK